MALVGCASGNQVIAVRRHAFVKDGVTRERFVNDVTAVENLVIEHGHTRYYLSFGGRTVVPDRETVEAILMALGYHRVEPAEAMVWQVYDPDSR